MKISIMNGLLSFKTKMDVTTDETKNMPNSRRNLLNWIASNIDLSAKENSNCVTFISDSESDFLADGKVLIVDNYVVVAYNIIRLYYNLY